MNEIIKDNEVILIEKESPTLIQKCQSIEIKNELTSKSANDILSALKKMLTKAEDKRKFLVKPAQDTVKRVNEEFKKITEPMQQAIDIIKVKILSYAQEVAAKEKKQIEKTAKLASDFLGEQVTVPVANTQVKSSLGTSFITKRWDFETINIEDVPFKYLQVNEQLVRQEIRENTKNEHGNNICALKIKGIKIFQRESIGTRV